MTHKNPFEIRAEVLALAKEYMDKQAELNAIYAVKMMEIGTMKRDELLEMYKPYTFEQLMEKANELYGFVQRKD